jgi:diketogulonate reductase-like aldo/keto reductase
MNSNNISERLSSTLKLNNGLEMPRIGLGTYKVKNLDNIVYQSIKNGVRMIDTATIYENEEEVGQGIKKAIDEKIVTREELFVVTKLWVNAKHEPEVSIKSSLERLGLEYVDLFLDHWPQSIYEKDGKRMATPMHVLWKSMEELVRKGYTKSIGVSNYNVQLLMDLLTFCEIKPVVNQVEYHPYLFQDKLNKFCKDFGIYLTAYNSLTRGAYVNRKDCRDLDLVKEPLIEEVAIKNGKSAGQVCLNWALIQDVIVIPATSNPNRMEENLEALSFRLNDEDFMKINTLDINFRFNPSYKLKFSLGYDIFA